MDMGFSTVENWHMLGRLSFSSVLEHWSYRGHFWRHTVFSLLHDGYESDSGLINATI